jgi:predicted metalloendopeptidase
MKDLRTRYQAYVDTLFRIAGFPDAPARAARVMALETKIARAHATRLESEDVHTPESWKREDFAKKAPGLDWTALFAAAHVGDAPRFIVWHPKAIPGLAALVASEPLDAWKDWLTFHAIDDASGLLPKAFVNAHFAFYGKALAGTPELTPRWKAGIDFTSGALGDVVGKVYAARYFPAETKKRVQDMVSDIIAAFGARIDAITWMTPATKAKARAKLAALRVGVGYPDMWADHTALQIVNGDLFGNASRAATFANQQQLAKLHKPVDRSEWWMTPQTVNAVNLPLQNALNFPAAIIAPPFFDASANAAQNYGAMGAIIGHEISHTFDNQGAEFDADGKLANWWTKEDFDHFKAAGEALARQYDTYRPFPDLAVNGHQTLGEDIADVAGLAAAYDAYRASLHGKELPASQGFTGDQQFFISFGQAWCTKEREELLRQEIATDVHAPARYRAATVRNIDAWYNAFSPKPGQKLYLDAKDRVRIW